MLLCASTRRSKAGSMPKSEFPTTQPILGVQMKIPPTIEPIVAYLALSPHRSVASRTEARPESLPR
jgi:hypothetical protein